MKRCIIFFIVSVCFLQYAVCAQTVFVEAGKRLPEHPRLLLKKGEEKALKKQIGKDAIWKEIHQTIMEESTALLDKPVSERIKTGRRLLSVSRENLRRIFFLSYAYRMSGDKKYFARAEQEMLKAASFSDWNPSHFLDVGEMTMALAIGYDWLYPQLSSQSRQTIEKAIIEKGFKPSLDERYNWFVNAVHNWNQVCHGGLAYGALAVWEKEPELTAKMLNRAIEKMAIPMKHYAPDGAYPEGVGYWEYGTSFNVIFLSALEKIFGSDFGLSNAPGFLKTGEYVLQMVTPTLRSFSYSDNGAGAFLSPTLFWFYDKTKDASILYNQARVYKKVGRNKLRNNRFAPVMLIWGASASLAKPVEPETLFWCAGGDNPVCAMRSGWEEKDMYVGVKLGSPSVNHGHMDVGSFIIEADSINWGVDLGGEEYNRLETRGVELWGSSQDAQRWDVFRYNNFAHNTLTFNQRLQRVKGKAEIEKSSENPNNMYVIADLTSVYEGQVKSIKRSVSLVEKKYAVVEDRIEAPKRFTMLTWSMVTPANAKIISDHVMLLEKGGKKLYLKVEGPKQVKWKVVPANSVYSYDSSNRGYNIVSFDTDLALNRVQHIRVYLLPDENKEVNYKSLFE
ncbi:heparinase II/III domain-containing protein [Parabacteroides pacaensis]|uniref:heparinase II/III domain-containing protein n=1 Tax=Parabacteroides pacaensis TaxID=2086575 RepID=UPI000D0E4A87|nr:heparinase II/III family protein [Parabacteroides pacaensis]